MMEETIGETQVDFIDRKTWLVVFGVLQIMLGAFCVFLTGMIGIISVMSIVSGGKGPLANADISGLIPGGLFYLLMAVWFIWMGIGSVKARRWARALILVTSWIWLIGGTTALITLAFMLPGFPAQPGPGTEMSGTMTTVFKIVMFGVMAVIYVLIPGVLVLFYRSRHVKATCEHRDPHMRWTDRCPLPVLAISLMTGGWALGMPFMGLYGWAIPFFGTVVNGAAGAVVILLMVPLLAYIAWGSYHLKIAAWRCALGLTIGWGASACVTFSRVGLFDLYEKMGLSQEHLALMKGSPVLQPAVMEGLTILWMVVVLAYVVYTKRFFVDPSGLA